MSTYLRAAFRIASSLCLVAVGIAGLPRAAAAQTLPRLRVSAPDSPESTGGKGTVVTVQVELSPAPVAPFTFQYQTFDIGPVPGFTIATPRVDYLETAGSLTLEPGQTMTSFTVTLLDDALLEGDEVVPVVVGQGEGVIPFANAGLRIIDDDSQRIAAPDVGFVNEADGQIVHVPITLSSVSGFDIDIPWKTLHVPDAPAGQALDPDDYIATSGTLRIPAGRLTGVVDIEVRGDRLREPDEFIVVSFEPPRGGAQLGGFFGLGFGVILDQR